MQLFKRRPFMRYVSCILQIIFFWQVKGIEAGALRYIDDAGRKSVMYRIYPEFERVGRVDIILQIFFKRKITYLGYKVYIVIVGIDVDDVIVIAVDEGCVGEEAAIEYMVPSGSTGGIAPLDAECIGERKHIPAEVSGKVNPVLIINFIIS